MADISEDLNQSLRYAREMRDMWTKQYNNLVAQAELEAGEDEELRCNGVLVFTNRHTASFRTSDFRREQPEAARFFTRKHMVEQEYIDQDELLRSRPELYNQYRSRSFRVVD